LQEENKRLSEEVQQNRIWKKRFEEMCKNESGMSGKDMDAMVSDAANVFLFLLMYFLFF